MMGKKKVVAYGTENFDQPFRQMEISRREPLSHDIDVEILYCGICHSDLHAAKNEWGNTSYPIVPGHEIIGRVSKVGSEVKKFKVGDLVGIGCIVDSCRECAYCKGSYEQFCEKGWTLVFNAPDKHLGGETYGGFSESIVVDENYAVRIPKKLDLPYAAPLLCAGITVYSPLKHWKAGAGKKVGIIGIGGLGHMAIKIAKAMGASVVVFTRSKSKVNEAKCLGADEVVISTDREQMYKQSELDLILDTASGKHDVSAYLNLLKVDGSLVLVGLPSEPLQVEPFSLVKGRKNFSGSNIGGIEETQEVVDFCAEHNILAEIELITVEQLNEAFSRLEKGDVKYRFVIDFQGS